MPTCGAGNKCGTTSRNQLHVFTRGGEGSLLPAPGQHFQRITVTTNQGFFLGAGPAFELGFALFSLLNGFVVFLIDEIGWGIKSSRPATITAEVIMNAAVEIRRCSNIQPSRFQAQNVHP